MHQAQRMLEENTNAYKFRLRRRFSYNSYFMLFGVGVSCRILYSFVSYLCISDSGSITSLGGREISFTCKNVVSVRRDLFFLLVLGLGFIISSEGTQGELIGWESSRRPSVRLCVRL